MEIDIGRVRELAEVARIAVCEEEYEPFRGDIAALERLCAPLLALSDEFSERYRARGTDAMREDQAGECLSPEEVARIAPAWENGYIPVPRTVEGGERE